MNIKRYIKLGWLILLFILLASCQRACEEIRSYLPYDPSAPTEEKFNMIRPWVPDDTDAILVMDMNKAFTSLFYKSLPEKFKENLPWALGHISSEVAPLRLGLVVFLLKIGEGGSGGFDKVLLLQGKFKKKEVLSEVYKSTGEEGISIEETKADGITIYEEKGEEKELSALAYIRPNLLAVGSKEGIKWLIERHKNRGYKSPEQKILSDIQLDPTVAARIVIPPAFKTKLPPMFSNLEEIKINADLAEGITVEAGLKLSDASAALALSKNLEGFKALEELANLDDRWLRILISSINIVPNDDIINIKIDLTQKVIELIKQANFSP